MEENCCKYSILARHKVGKIHILFNILVFLNFKLNRFENLTFG